MIPTKISPSSPSPSSSSSSYSTSSSSLVMHPRRRRRFDHTTNGASLVIAYLLFAACMSLVVVLPLSFFVVNYGTCSYFCGWFCRHKASLVDVNTRERRVTKDHVSLDNELNPMDIEMINVENDYFSDEEEEEEEEKEEEEGKETEEGWERHLDDSTGFYYLYNASNGETKWEDYEIEDVGELQRVESFRTENQSSLIRVESFRSEKGEDKTVVKISDEYAEKRDSLLVRARHLAEAGQSKQANGWIETVDDEGITCYVKLETGEVRYNKPPRWVMAMAKLFNGNHNHNASAKRKF